VPVSIATRGTSPSGPHGGGWVIEDDIVVPIYTIERPKKDYYLVTKLDANSPVEVGVSLRPGEV
jgi:hypothetical protein